MSAEVDLGCGWHLPSSKAPGVGVTVCGRVSEPLFPARLSGCDSGGAALSASVSFPVKGRHVTTSLVERSRDHMGWCVGAE